MFDCTDTAMPTRMLVSGGNRFRILWTGQEPGSVVITKAKFGCTESLLTATSTTAAYAQVVVGSLPVDAAATSCGEQRRASSNKRWVRQLNCMHTAASRADRKEKQRRWSGVGRSSNKTHRKRRLCLWRQEEKPGRVRQCAGVDGEERKKEEAEEVEEEERCPKCGEELRGEWMKSNDLGWGDADFDSAVNEDTPRGRTGCLERLFFGFFLRCRKRAALYVSGWDFNIRDLGRLRRLALFEGLASIL